MAILGELQILTNIVNYTVLHSAGRAQETLQRQLHLLEPAEPGEAGIGRRDPAGLIPCGGDRDSVCAGDPGGEGGGRRHWRRSSG